MRRLAIDTSSVACTVALQFDDQIFERHEEQAREHTRLLLPMIRDLLREASVEMRDLDAIVLGNGPGSFIGMRIAASVAQGLAFAAGLNIVAVSSLAAVAAEVLQTSSSDIVAVAQDAHMQEIYLGLYSRGKLDDPELLAAERLHAIGKIEEIQKRHAKTVVAAGQGWLRYPDHFAVNADRFTGPSSVLYPQARYLLPLSEALDGVNPASIEPAYLRHKVAEKSVPEKS